MKAEEVISRIELSDWWEIYADDQMLSDIIFNLIWTTKNDYQYKKQIAELKNWAAKNGIKVII
jgi:hypothetical protein